ncbi:hypothetical protein [Clostridium puniceum]|nr:hypothetical protein [Clostridium puniceum]
MKRGQLSTTTNTNINNNSNNSNVINDQSQMVYVSDKRIYHKSSNAHEMKNYTTMSLSEAQAKGYKVSKVVTNKIVD